MNRLQMWLMKRYCPDFEKKMPEDKPGRWKASTIVIWGYWGHKSAVVESREVRGFRNAYLTARWLALKAQWKRPAWLTGYGINYGVSKIDLTEIADVVNVLKGLEITHSLDSCNPAYTLHVGREGDTIYGDDAKGPWTIGGYDHLTRRFSKPFRTADEMKAQLADFGYAT